MSKQFTYSPKGVCSRKISFELDDGKVKNVHFDGGCNGNTKGLSSLVRGMDANEAISRLEGITCGSKATSCPDQLAHALRQALNEN